MNQLVSAFGRNLRRLRTERNLSQKGLADAVGIQQAMISNIEGGDRRPSFATATAIASFLGVSLDEMSRDHESAIPAAADAA